MNPLLKNYFPVADIIAGTFGAGCEVAVHDLEQPDRSVVYVAGSVTGRKKGQTFDHLVKNVLLSDRFENDRVINYTFEANGKTIRSSSALIRDEAGQVIGMICINCDLSAPAAMKAALDAFLNAGGGNAVVEEPDQNVVDVIDGLIAKIIGGTNVRESSRQKLVELVRFMDDKGIFLVRGSMEKVANLLGVSKVTLYSYLDEAKGKR